MVIRLHILNMNALAKLKKLFFTLLITIFIAGCGVKTLYNQLDWLIPWYVEDFITLDERQQAELDKRLSGVLVWHRTTQLSEYSAFLRKAKAEIGKGKGITEQQIDEIFLNFDASWRTLMKKVAPDIVDILLSATPEQKQELFDNIETRDEEFYDDFVALSEQERLTDRIEAMQENFERWLGELSEDQKNLIVNYANKFAPIHFDRLQFRYAWRKQFRKLMYADPRTAQIRQQLEQLFIDPRFLYTKQYQNKREGNIKLVKQMLLELDSSITPQQFEHLIEQLDKFAIIFEELSVET